MERPVAWLRAGFNTSDGSLDPGEGEENREEGDGQRNTHFKERDICQKNARTHIHTFPPFPSASAEQ